jgi:hypothetical protein
MKYKFLPYVENKTLVFKKKIINKRLKWKLKDKCNFFTDSKIDQVLKWPPCCLTYVFERCPFMMVKFVQRAVQMNICCMLTTRNCNASRIIGLSVSSNATFTSVFRPTHSFPRAYPIPISTQVPSSIILPSILKTTTSLLFSSCTSFLKIISADLVLPSAFSSSVCWNPSF